MRKKKTQTLKTNWADREKIVTLSIENARSGGLGLFALRLLKDAGIPARRGVTVYQDHVGIEVPKRFAARAEKLIF
jgi:hypothetical protein